MTRAAAVWPNERAVTFIAARCMAEQGRHPKAQFSVKVGTIFEDSQLSVSKWPSTVWLIANCKNGIWSWELHCVLGGTQKTAWLMLHLVRLAMQDNNGGTLNGGFERDETFIGGKARDMRKAKREEKLHGTAVE